MQDLRAGDGAGVFDVEDGAGVSCGGWAGFGGWWVGDCKGGERKCCVGEAVAATVSW